MFIVLANGPESKDINEFIKEIELNNFKKDKLIYKGHLEKIRPYQVMLFEIVENSIFAIPTSKNNGYEDAVYVTEED